MTDSTRTRVALVAGGTGGIGKAVSRELSAAGMSVYIGASRSLQAARKLASEISVAGNRAQAVQMDVRDGVQVNTACEDIFNCEGSLDVLVNCAAISSEAPALGMDDETWDDTMAVNLDGAFRLCRTVSKFMLLGRWGRIVNFSSVSAAHGGRGQIGYATSKAAVEAMTRVLALELGRKGVLVNCVAPGVIETDMSRRVRAEYSQQILNQIAMRRFGDPEEIAAVVSFLVSDAANYITGQVIRVDGGMGL